MKLNRSYLFIAISSVALLTVLIIQFNWILETAKIKEELFNEKASMVLSKTAAALSSDSVAVKQLEICVGRNEVHKIDSLLIHYMGLYNIKIDYFFEVKPNAVTGGTKENAYGPFQSQSGCYKTCVGPASDGSGMELKLVFPDKEQFVIDELGLPFISSVLLILLVLIMSWQTIFSLQKEKKISQHTSDFLNNMTHEFKTPLTNIALAGKMMLKDKNIGQQDKIKYYTNIIHDENEKLQQQVEQVLSMTALERGEIPLQKKNLDFHQLIHESLKYIMVQVENRQGSLKLMLNADAHNIEGDQGHLSNTICNLVENAIKYSHSSPELTVVTFNTAEAMAIVVSDNGIGIEEKYHDQIFDKFFRVPTGNIHNVKGFGLGLAYVKQIVALHGGSISVESAKGSGSAFIIKMPYV